MREVQPASANPGRVFYTIRPEDVGKGIIQTETGPIIVHDVLGRVQPGDVGTLLYRVPTDGGLGWYWTREVSVAAIDPELFRRSAPAWNCVAYPLDGMHYVTPDGDCNWCGMTAEQIAREPRRTP